MYELVERFNNIKHELTMGRVTEEKAISAILDRQALLMGAIVLVFDEIVKLANK